MKINFSFYALLLVLVIADAWLLSHPNLIGRFGVWFYKYDMIRTFPRALGTVALTAIVGIGISEILKRRKLSIAKIGFLILILASIGLLIDTYFKFSKGTYSLTGSGFKTGALLLPLLLILIFGNGLYEVLTQKTKA
ncbi:MAG: hypothetical protein ACK4GN_15735 [Runella sp.]